MTVQKSGAQIVHSPQQSSRFLAKASKYYLLEGTTSPNKRYAIFWGIPGRTSNSANIEPNDDIEQVENYLVDLQTNKIITTIRDCKYFPHQNHGDIFTQWSANSQLVLVTHDGRWQPHSVSLVSINGVQLNLFEQLVRNVRSYLAKNDGVAYQNNKEKLAVGLEFGSNLLQVNNNQLQLPVMVDIPKAENGYERHLLVTYQVAKVSNNFKLQLLAVKNNIKLN